MLTTKIIRCAYIVAATVLTASSTAQSILPPLMEWHGKSESLIAKATNPWITPAEKADFVSTPKM